MTLMMTDLDAQWLKVDAKFVGDDRTANHTFHFNHKKNRLISLSPILARHHGVYFRAGH